MLLEMLRPLFQLPKLDIGRVLRYNILGFEVRDWPRLIRVRLTICRKYGHRIPLQCNSRYSIDSYCWNCGQPWLSYRRF